MKVLSDIPTLYQADVVIVGAGSAGCCAAIAAAEEGRSVVLIERYGFAGGTSTQILDTFYGFFTPGEEPRKVVGGIPDRVVDTLDLTGDIFLRPNALKSCKVASTGSVQCLSDLARWPQLPLTRGGVIAVPT